MLYPSMKLAPKAVRLSAWKYQHAEICMGMVHELCDRIPKYDLATEISDLVGFYSLFTSIHLLYGRPFQQRGDVKLEKSAVPKSKIQIHDSTINLRNKMFAHIDTGKNAVRDDSGDELANMIIHNTGDNLFCISSSLIPTQTGLLDIKGLATDVRNYCQGKLGAIFGEYLADPSKLAVGMFKINILDEGDAPIIVSWSGV